MAARTKARSTRQSDKARQRLQLQQLRREAGYHSAKDFAAVLNIPASTYSRYERAAKGPHCGIPLAAAWAMADKLGVSIDLLVGRRGIEPPPPVTLDMRADKLSRSGREMLDDFMQYLEFRETPAAQYLQ